MTAWESGNGHLLVSALTGPSEVRPTDGGMGKEEREPQLSDMHASAFSKTALTFNILHYVIHSLFYDLLIFKKMLHSKIGSFDLLLGIIFFLR